MTRSTKRLRATAKRKRAARLAGWRLCRERRVLEVEIRGEEERAEPLSRRLASAQRTTHQAARSVRNLFDAWPGIIERLKGAEFRLLLLDFDGTLVRLRRRPEDVRFS